MRIEYSRRFLKEFKKCPVKIQAAFKQKIKIFINDKSNIILNNHKLIGNLKGYRSINITSDWRAIFQEFDKEKIVYFVMIGTHSNLYNK